MKGSRKKSYFQTGSAIKALHPSPLIAVPLGHLIFKWQAPLNGTAVKKNKLFFAALKKWNSGMTPSEKGLLYDGVI